MVVFALGLLPPVLHLDEHVLQHSIGYLSPLSLHYYLLLVVVEEHSTTCGLLEATTQLKS